MGETHRGLGSPHQVGGDLEDVEGDSMSRQKMARRLDRLEATASNRNKEDSDSLLRVAGKTKEQSRADLIEYFRRLLAQVHCPVLREEFFQKIAASDQQIADELRSLFPAVPTGRQTNGPRSAV